MRTPHVMSTLVATALLLTGCAVARDGGAAPSSPSASADAPRACPSPVEYTGELDCVPYDPDAAMAQNEGYRERFDLSAADQSEMEKLIQPVTDALTPLSLDGQKPTLDDVRAALISAGVPSDGIVGYEGSGVAFGASTTHGCVFGGVSAGRVEVAVGGPIADGGCLPAQGH